LSEGRYAKHGGETLDTDIRGKLSEERREQRR
jgi:hypothetical protein